MYTTSEDYKTVINNPSRKFECKVMCGSKTYTNVNIVSINITGSLQPSGYTIGSAISHKATFKFINDGNVTFPSNTIELQIGLLVNGAYEYIPIGKYTIDSHDSDDYTITIVAYDNMMKFESKYNGTGTTLRAIAQEICNSCGVTLGSTIPTTTVTTPTSGKYTNREIIGYIAGCMCGNAVIDRVGQLKIQKLNLSTIDKQVTTDNWFTYKNADMIFSIEKLICDTGSGKIESGSSTDEAKQLTIKNPLMTQDTLDSVKAELSNIIFAGFNVKYQGDISTDLGDTVKVIDRKGQTLVAPLLQRTLNYNGGLTEDIKTEGKKKVDVASSYYANGRYSLDFDKYNYDMADFNTQLGDFDVSLGNFNFALTGLTDRVTALENGGVVTNNVSEYVIDTTLTEKTTKTFTFQAKTGTTITTDWGDGTTDNNTTHTYASDGVYTIKTTSQYPPKRYSASGDIWQECLVEVIKLSEIITNGSAGFYNYVNLKKVGDILGIENAYEMFQGCTRLKYPANVGDKIKNCSYMYYGCTSLVDVSTYRDSMEDTSSMYYGCTSLEYTGDMADNITNSEGMFSGCTNLKKIGHLSSKLVIANNMFLNCTGLKMIGKNIDLPNTIKNANNMFYGCSNLNANIYWPSSLETAQSMFENCSSMENFRDIVNLTYLSNMHSMFRGCTNATFSDLTKCPPNVTDLGYCFWNCSNLQLPTDFFDNVVSSTVDATCCFQNCTSLTNGIDVKNTFNADRMFKGSGAIETSNTVPKQNCWGSMYEDCINLTTINSGMYILMQNNPTNGNRCFRHCTNIISPDTYDNLDSLYPSWMYKNIVVS